MDDQVKIRGFRIELGEIEHCLAVHKNVAQAVVTVIEDKNGDRHLCAYIVVRGGEAIEAGDWRSELSAHLAENLPAYMIPSYFTQVQTIPLTASGKLDRRALPRPRIDPGTAYSPPRDELEKKLAAVWSELLGLGDQTGGAVGIDSNFFRLGGHSLKANALVARVNREFNVKLPLAQVFQAPTIRGQAQCIRELGEERHQPIEPAEEREYYPLSPAQQRVFVAHRLHENDITYNIPLVQALEGNLCRQRLEDAFQRLILRQQVLGTSIQIIDDRPCQVIHRPGDISFSIEYYENPSGAVGQIVDGFIRPFDLSEAPLLRVGLIKQGESSHILMVDMHHIITDGTSTAIFIDELLAFYADRPLLPLKLQYRDFACWCARMWTDEKNGPGLQRLEQYWLERFKGDIPRLKLPTDFPRPPAGGPGGGLFDFTIDGRTAAGIRRLMEQSETTLYMVLLAVLNVLLAKYSLRDDIVIGTGAAGRGHAGLENIMGMFVNMVAVRSRPGEEKSFSTFLQEVKKNALEAFEHQDYPFEKLVEKLGIERENGKNPLFDVEFTVQNTPAARMEMTGTGIQVKPFTGIEYKRSKFDLGFSVFERDDSIDIALSYAARLFKPSTIETLVRHYMEVLRQVLEESHIKLKDIGLSHKRTSAPALLKQEEIRFGF
jgi:acyl carrier protein